MILLQNMIRLDVMMDIMLKGKQNMAKYSHINMLTPVNIMRTSYLCL